MPPQTRISHRLFLAAVFSAIGIAIAVSFVFYSLQPAGPVPTSHLVFTPAVVVDGNASFAVQNVSGGPYPSTGFQIALTVNDFSNSPIPLGPNNSSVRVSIGPNSYRIEWQDANGDGAVDVGDSFLVTGDGGSLPALSYFELDLRWQAAWTAKVTWSTP